MVAFLLLALLPCASARSPQPSPPSDSGLVSDRVGVEIVTSQRLLARHRFREAIDVLANLDPPAPLDLAVELLRLRALDGLRTDDLAPFTAAASRFPGNPTIMLLIGKWHLRRGDPLLAKSLFIASWEAGASSVAAYWVAVAFMDQGDFEQARTWFVTSIAVRDPDDALARKSGVELTGMSRQDKAMRRRMGP